MIYQSILALRSGGHGSSTLDPPDVESQSTHGHGLLVRHYSGIDPVSVILSDPVV